MQHMLVLPIMFRKLLNKIYLLVNTHLSNGQKPMGICMGVDLFKVYNLPQQLFVFHISDLLPSPDGEDAAPSHMSFLGSKCL